MGLIFNQYRYRPAQILPTQHCFFFGEQKRPVIAVYPFILLSLSTLLRGNVKRTGMVLHDLPVLGGTDERTPIMTGKMLHSFTLFHRR